MSTSILNFNLQANVATLRTSNSWSVSTNLTPSFNSYPEVNRLGNGPALSTSFQVLDIVKNAVSNVIYTCNTDGVSQYVYSDNNVVGSITAYANAVALSLPISNYKSLDISPDGSKIFVMDSFGIVSSANLSTNWNVYTAIGAVAGNTWMKSKNAGQTHSDYYVREDGNKLYIFNNNGTIEQYSLSNGDFRTAQVEHVSASIGSGQLYGYFSDAGDRLFCLRGGLSNIVWISQYDLSESWNVNSAAFVADFAPIDVGGGLRDGSGIRLSSDGANAYYFATSASNGTRYLHRLNMSSSWNIASRSGSYSDRTSAFLSTDRTFDFKDDGTQIYISPATTGLRSYNLSTPWSITSVTSNTSVDLNIRGTARTGISIFDSGTKIVFGSNTSNTIHSAYMSPWNIGTLSFLRVDTNLLDVKPQISVGSTYLRIGADSSNIMLNSGATFYNYRMSSNLELGSTTFFGSKASGGGSTPDHYTISADGTTIYQARVGTIIQTGTVDKLTMNPSWNISSLSVTADSKAVTGSTSTLKVMLSNPQTKYTIMDNEYRLTTFTQPTNNTLSSSVFRSNGIGRYTLTNFENDPGLGLKFTNDGMYFLVCQSNTLYLHKLSKAWDVSSVTNVYDKSVSTSSSVFNGFTISRNGKYVYLLETSSGEMDRHELLRPWDIQQSSLLPLTGNYGLYWNSPLYDAEFSNDGSVNIVSDSSGIKSYRTSSPWLPTADTSGTTLVSNTGPRPFAMSRNGKYLYTPNTLNGVTYVRRYTLTTPWIGPATLSQEVAIPGSKNWIVYGIATDPAGNTIYLFDAKSKTIFSYSLGAT